MLPIPKEDMILGFTDDLGVGIAAKHPEDVDVYATEVLSAVKT